MPFYTDPIDTILTGLFAKPRVLQKDPSPRATGRCPECRYLVVLPCAVCAQRLPSTRLATQTIGRQDSVPPRNAKAQEIFALALAWVQAHPQRELTANAIDHDPHFPFQRQYVYNYWGKVSLLNRLVREQAFPSSEHAKIYQKHGEVNALD